MKKTKKIKSSGWFRGTPRNPRTPIRPQYQFILISIVFPTTSLVYASAYKNLYEYVFLRFRDLKFFDFALVVPSVSSFA